MKLRSESVSTYCPKCGGRLYLDRDLHGWYEQCMNCGYTRDLPTVVEAEPEKVTAHKRSESHRRGRSGLG